MILVRADCHALFPRAPMQGILWLTLSRQSRTSPTTRRPGRVPRTEKPLSGGNPWLTHHPAQRQCRHRRRPDFARSGAAARFRPRRGEPIKIGFSMALTGPLAANGKQALLGAQIWQEEVNAKGGLLGRQVQLINYDDQSNPATVPGIYTKLLEVDKVDLVVSAYATNMVAPAIPIVMQKNKTFISLFALDANSEFHYPKYFSMLPSGPDAEADLQRRLLPGRRRAKSEAEDRGDRGRGRRVLAQRRRRRPRQHQAIRLRGHLRQNLPAEHDRLLADRPRHPGGQCRPRGDLLLSAELGRHAAVRQRARLEAEDDGRRAWSDCRQPPSRTS